MGGGTGTGAAPVIAGIAKSMGILTVGIITIPFYFEKRKKIVKALQGVEEMRKNVDALLIVNNERLCDVYADSEITVKDAFKLADKVLSDATKAYRTARAANLGEEDKRQTEENSQRFRHHYGR